METINEAKIFLRKNWEKGVDCPCCGQLVKRYSRPISHTMARMLINLYRLNQRNSRYYHTTEINGELKLSGTADFAKLRYWNLIDEQKENQNQKTKTSGFWKITNKGIDFAENKIQLQSHVLIYNAKFLAFTGDYISIKDCFGKFFNYSELMGEFDTNVPAGQTSLL